MTEVIAFFSNPTVRDVSFGAIVILVVVLIITGRLVPLRTHKRELDNATKERDAWHDAHTVSETARGKLAIENFKQSETIRVAGIKPTEPANDGGG